MTDKIVTRMPPSPTGHLHIGTARTALFNYLFAKHHGGEMLFRSEDTDRARSTREFEEEIIEGLNWLGISWDNTEIIRQSERTEIYKKYINTLLESDAAYISEEPKKDDPSVTVKVVRLRNPNREITFNDLIRGEITFDTTELGDMVIARSIDDPLYHLTVVVDDHEMGVTHVLRGEDHISNTPRQILIQEAIGSKRPVYAHLPLILAPDRSKMSKRHGAVALSEYRKEGFLKEAIVNYLALLGWNSGTDEEIYSLKELIEIFDIDKIHKSGAIFDLNKFIWINKQHLAQLGEKGFSSYIQNGLSDAIRGLPQYDEARVTRLIPTLRERISTYDDLTEGFDTTGEFAFVFTAPTQNSELLKWKKDTTVHDALPRLQHILSLLESIDFSDQGALHDSIFNYADEIGKGEVLWPLRVALTGQKQSPDPITCLYVLGKDESLQRIEAACDAIKTA